MKKIFINQLKIAIELNKKKKLIYYHQTHQFSAILLN